MIKQFEILSKNGANLLVPRGWNERVLTKPKSDQTNSLDTPNCKVKNLHKRFEDDGNEYIGDNDHAPNAWNTPPVKSAEGIEQLDAMIHRKLEEKNRALAKATKIRDKRMIQIFDMKMIENAKLKAKKSSREDRDRITIDLNKAERDDGKRIIPTFSGVAKKMQKLNYQFPNFKNVIKGLHEELVLASMMPADKFHVAPMLGWTACQELAKLHFQRL